MSPFKRVVYVVSLYSGVRDTVRPSDRKVELYLIGIGCKHTRNFVCTARHNMLKNSKCHISSFDPLEKVYVNTRSYRTGIVGLEVAHVNFFEEIQ